MCGCAWGRYWVFGGAQCAWENEYLTRRPRIPHPNLLVHEEGSPLTRFQFKRVCQLALTKLGVHTVDFSSHSFQIWVATNAAALGMGPGLIQAMGHWKSDCFRRYVRPHLGPHYKLGGCGSIHSVCGSEQTRADPQSLRMVRQPYCKLTAQTAVNLVNPQ